ncbi:hypothetical protein Pcinc_015806 [Petrolisthes cinctipes]|uniref:Uncharacterized protein n=1 Tax=Petrolisthes cinctipes TaxID=88211 RepID=A0AAE1FU14_PETCI|nr:hypothetical protein Pcinc_015806 [Petrolisthes cinctipes]
MANDVQYVWLAYSPYSCAGHMLFGLAGCRVKDWKLDACVRDGLAERCTDELERVELQTVELETTVELEWVELETVELEWVELETVELEWVELESLV